MVDQQSLDEFDLLGEELESDRIYTGDINEDELLGLNEQPESVNKSTNPPATVDETEQLDYEEDEEEKKPRDKFESEKKRETGNDESNQKSSSKCFVNPKFQNRLQNSGSPSSLPSLLSRPIMAPPQIMRPPVDVNTMTQMVLMNSLRPIVPPNQMMRPMGSGMPIQNMTFPPPVISSMGMQGRPIGPVPITAQIGQLSTVIHQQDDGTVTFRTTIPVNQPPRVTIARAGCSDQNKDWNSMVDEFIGAPSKSSRKRDRRSRSISSRSNSASSYSDSYSDSYSSASSRSPSPSRYRRRRHRSPSRKRSYHRSDRHSRRYRSRRRHSRSPRHRRTSKSDELKNTLECAEAVGVDEDYVQKLEQQKKLREEVARKKYQRDNGGSRSDESKRIRIDGASSSRHPEEKQSRSTKIEPITQFQSNSNGDNKVKPYLVVVINNLANLSDAYKRIKMIALAIGPLKKVWQTSDDSVSIIFEHHENAKNFMLQYHMKQFNGITLNITLEKIFLNLASIP